MTTPISTLPAVQVVGWTDTGLARAAAGQVSITNGAATTYLTFGLDSGSAALIQNPNAGGLNVKIADSQSCIIVGAGNGTFFGVSNGGNTTSRTGLDGIRLMSSSYYSFTNSATNANIPPDTALTRAAASVLSVTNGSSGVGWIQNSAAETRRVATQTVTDSTTFAADNTLTSTLLAGRKYRFKIRYYFTTVNTSGVKVDLNGGSATMTAINGTIKVLSSTMTLLGGGQITALNTSVGVTATGTFAVVEIDGSMQCNAAGTFIPEFAQNAETGAAESVIAQIGSFMELGDEP